MAFSENLRTLNSILSSDLLIESRYDIMFNLSALNTYANTGVAGVVQLAPSTEISEGDGFGVITPGYLSGATLEYPLSYNTSFVTTTLLSGDTSSLASVEYVESAILASAYNPAVLESTYLKRNATSVPLATEIYDLGSSTSKWDNIYAVSFQGTATFAEYGDLGERYTCAEEVEVGDLVSVHTGEGDFDVAKSQGENDLAIIGIVSEAPAFIMSSEIDGPCVGLTGKLPVKVIGACKKGDRLVASSTKGVATATYNSFGVGAPIIGFALETKTDEDISLIKAIIK